MLSLPISFFVCINVLQLLNPPVCYLAYPNGCFKMRLRIEGTYSG